VRQIAVQPVQWPWQRHGGCSDDATGEGDELGSVATLSRCPRDLYALWAEYEYGIAGRKPARQFTAQERGKVKFKYSRRKIVWDTIDRMVRSGSTAQVACDRIYAVYGRNKSVTDIMRCLRQDAPAGHPNLW
jgi:hypothetical protein